VGVDGVPFPWQFPALADDGQDGEQQGVARQLSIEVDALIESRSR
jgi:hypothetical protein